MSWRRIDWRRRIIGFRWVSRPTSIMFRWVFHDGSHYSNVSNQNRIFQYNTVLSNQLKKDGGPMLLQTFHWYIETPHADAFLVDGELYEAVSLIMETDVEHWYCARPGWSISGSRVRLRNGKTELDNAEKAKARIANCLAAASPPPKMRQQNRRVCQKRLSLCTISEELWHTVWLILCSVCDIFFSLCP